MSELDSLQRSGTEELNILNLNYEKNLNKIRGHCGLNKEYIEEQAKILIVLQENLEKREDELEKELCQLSDSLNKLIVNKVKNHISEYCQKNNIDILIDSSNILYSNEGCDITQSLLTEILLLPEEKITIKTQN